MRKKLYEMTKAELEKFHEEFIYEDLIDMHEDELKYVDRGYLVEQLVLHDFDDIADSIDAKLEHNIDLNEEEEDYLEWGDKVDYDLGQPIMSSEMLLNM